MTAPAPAATAPAAPAADPGATPAAPPAGGPGPVQFTTPIGNPTPNVVPPGATVAGQTPPAPAVNVPSWYADGPEAAIDYVRRATDQAASARAELQAARAAQEAAVEAERQRIGKALGYIKDDGSSLTPEQLTERHAAERAADQAKIRDLTISNALTGALAGTHPGTLDALKGSGRLTDLDPNAPDFTTQLQTRVTEYLDANPYFRVTTGITPPVTAPLAGSTSGEIPGVTPLPPGGDLDVDALRKARAERRAG